MYIETDKHSSYTLKFYTVLLIQTFYSRGSAGKGKRKLEHIKFLLLLETYRAVGVENKIDLEKKDGRLILQLGFFENTDLGI